MHQPKVVIFMGTYNGQHYLVEQLESICSQTYKHWELWVSDDGSDDDTIQILKNFQRRLGEDVLFILSGPKKGFAANFLSLVCNQQAKGTYYAYSDQDDIWVNNKLQTAIDWLHTISELTPALYCTRTTLINKNGQFIGHSPLFKKNPSFLNALVQNIAGGNTMIFNHAALKLLQTAGQQITIVAHDWWTYLLVTGAGGIVFYDPKPTIFYRQHESNIIGSNIGLCARIARIVMLFKGRFKTWNDINYQALNAIQHVLTRKNRRILNNLIMLRQQRLAFRMITIKKLGIYRQTFFGNIGLITATIFKKF